VPQHKTGIGGDDTENRELWSARLDSRFELRRPITQQRRWPRVNFRRGKDTPFAQTLFGDPGSEGSQETVTEWIGECRGQSLWTATMAE
jgi:hypothetical protein